MVPLPLDFFFGLTSTHLTCLILSIISLWSNASPTFSDNRQITHQNQARDNRPAQTPNFIRCIGRAPLPSWRYWPAGVDPQQYANLRQLCAPIQPPSLGFVCPIESGFPIQVPEYASPSLRSIWPLVKICRERCWCPQPNDPNHGDEDVGFSGESDSNMESDSESDPNSDSNPDYSDYSGPGDYDSDADMMLSDKESVYGGRQRQNKLQSQCLLSDGVTKCGTPINLVRHHSILPPSRCGERCYSVAQKCNQRTSSTALSPGAGTCTCAARLYKNTEKPYLPGRWLAKCLVQHTRTHSLGGRGVGVDNGNGGGIGDGDVDSYDDVDNEYGAAGAVDGDLLPSITACPCNSTYISRACCDTTDGLVWEGTHKYLGRLDMDWAWDGEL